jgi:phospholipid-binding lipoprotein MlaA
MLFAACAFTALAPLPAGASTIGSSDPFEPMNRAFFGFHQVLDHVLIRPAAVAYKRILPKPVRSGVAHVFSNLGEPAVFVNDVLQGHVKEATETFTRFAGNTTFGLLGVFDVATHAGLPHHSNDFGITLARYGVKPGPYIFIPLAGPTTVRDAVGSLASLAMNPLVLLRYAGDGAVGVTSVAGEGLQSRADADDQLKALFAGATDPYASFRSYFLQNRQALVKGGRIDIEELPDFDSPGAAAAGPAPASTTPTMAPPSSNAPATTALASPLLSAPPPAASSSGAASSQGSSNASASALTAVTTQAVITQAVITQAVATQAVAAVATSVVGSATIAQP